MDHKKNVDVNMKKWTKPTAGFICENDVSNYIQAYAITCFIGKIGK